MKNRTYGKSILFLLMGTLFVSCLIGCGNSSNIPNNTSVKTNEMNEQSDIEKLEKKNSNKISPKTQKKETKSSAKEESSRNADVKSQNYEDILKKYYDDKEINNHLKYNFSPYFYLLDCDLFNRANSAFGRLSMIIPIQQKAKNDYEIRNAIRKQLNINRIVKKQDEGDYVAFAYNENGKLKSYSRFIDGEEAEKGRVEFDDKGNSIVEEVYFLDSNQKQETNYEYDSQGFLEKIVTSNTYGSRFESVYDVKGNCTSYAEYSDGSLSWKSEYGFDNNGNQVSRVNYGYDGKIESQEKSRYDQYGNQLSYVEYKGDTIEQWWESSYDQSGNEVSHIIFNPDGSIYLSYENSYDTYGNLITSKAFGEDGLLDYKTLLTYDRNKNLISMVEYDTYDTEIMKVDYSYDSDGRLVRYYCTDGGNFEFSYDTNGKLIAANDYKYGLKMELEYANNGKLSSFVIKDGREVMEMYEINYYL